MTTKYSNLISAALEELKNNDDLFVDMVNELDSWDGFADGFRGWYMDDIDDLFSGCSVRDFLDKLGNDFNHNDAYFMDTIYGLESCNDLATWYRDHADEGEVLDNIIDKYNHITIFDKDFDDLIFDIVNYTEDDEEEGEDVA